MNILTDQMPDAIDVGGQVVEINTDFKTCLTIIMAFEDDDLATVEKQMVLIGNLYKTQPDNIQEAFSQGIKFLNGGTSHIDDEESGMRLYSFKKDASYIFAAFRQTHGIDLETDNFHWWKFLALFSDLGADTTFCNLVSLRKRVKTGKATKEERAAAREMGDMFEINDFDTRTLEEKEMAEKFFSLIGR